MESPGKALRAAITHALPLLRVMSEEHAAARPAPGKWSPKEVIGHLIDSASNNHQRFVRAQLGRTEPFEGYAQDDWVAIQRYNDAEWSALIELWAGFNLHLAHVMDHSPPAELERARPELRLQDLAFRPAPEPVTLGWFMQDYVEHLKHHLRQIEAGLVAGR